MPVALKYVHLFTSRSLYINSSKVRLGWEGYKHVQVLQNILKDGFIDPFK